MATQSGVITNISNWAAQPFSEDMDVGSWALFVGLIACLSILWALVIHRITEVV